MHKANIAKLAMHLDFNYRRSGVCVVIEKSCKQNCKRISDGKKADMRKRSRACVFVQSITLKLWKCNFNSAGDNTENNHYHKLSAVVLYIRNDFSYAEKAKLFFFALQLYRLLGVGLCLVYFLINSARRFKLVMCALFTDSAVIKNNNFIGGGKRCDSV